MNMATFNNALSEMVSLSASTIVKEMIAAIMIMDAQHQISPLSSFATVPLLYKVKVTSAVNIIRVHKSLLLNEALCKALGDDSDALLSDAARSLPSVKATYSKETEYLSVEL